MLVQKALRALDGEIDRLTRIRNIVATLHTVRSPVDLPIAEPHEPIQKLSERVLVSSAEVSQGKISESVPSPVLGERVPSRKLRMERTTRVKRATPPVARALGGQIPVKPVYFASGPPPRVVKPDVTANGGPGEAKKAPEGGLDALLRELAHRPSPGF